MLFSLLRRMLAGHSHHARPVAEAPAPAHDLAMAGRLDDISRHMAKIAEGIGHVQVICALHFQTDAELLLRQILAEPRHSDPLRLERYGYKTYSQNDEDGIIGEIFRRIGVTNRCFLEFGVENGLENNTLCLLEQGWSGAWIEGDARQVASIEQGFGGKIAAGNLRVRTAMIDRGNINGLILGFALPRDIDLLSIDIDGNDYHVWEAITVIEPRVVVIEYNAKFRPPMHWVMRYDPAHRWDGTDQFGASLESMADLGRRKGYQLVGCNITGANAFFVRSDIAGGQFISPADAATLYQPVRYFLSEYFVSGPRVGYSRKQ